MPRPFPQPATLRLVCWKGADAERRAAELRRAGYRVVADPLANPGGAVRYFRELNPDAVVIDLDRLPSHGRELGMSLRASKSTCHLPLIFAGGIAEKIDAIRAAIPGAIFAAWDDDVAAAIERAKDQPAAPRLRSPELPKPTGPGALERKLDIKPQTRFAVVALSGDVSWLTDLLTSIPDSVVAQHRIDRTTTLALFIVHTRRDLARAFALARTSLPSAASFWIIHPKQTSRLAADFNQDDVREAGLGQGFVDYKVCAVDKDWSALKFARRDITKAKPHIMRRS
jgi:CheY-like chemotaxis protein